MDATIHLRVPATVKASWVRKSRAAGMRLTDWIVQRVEREEAAVQRAVDIHIPEDLTFASLRLARDPDGEVSFDTSVVERIAVASGLPADYWMTQPEDAVSSLIVAWYRHHRAAGGAPDPTAEDLITEVHLEDERGGGLSHEPGRA